MPATFYHFRARTATVLLSILIFSVAAFGTVDTWAEAVVVAAVFLVAFTWAGRYLFLPFPLIGKWHVVPLVLVALAALAQLSLGVTPHPYETAGELLKWLTYIAFFLLLVNALSDQWIRGRFVRSLAWFGFVISAVALVQHYVSPDAAYGFREAPSATIFGPFADRNHFAVLIELLFPGALLIALRASEGRFLYFVLCGLMLAAVIVSQSRAGFVIVMAEFAVLVLARAVLVARRSSRRRKSKALLSLAAMVAVGIVLILAAGVDRLRERFEPETLSRGMSRFAVASQTWDLYQQKPWLGYGLGLFDEVFAGHVSDRDEGRWNAAHCDPVQLPMEAGVAGLLAQALMICLLLARRRSSRVWLGGVLPLAAAYAHSCVEFPLQMPSLVLTALAILAWTVTAPARDPDSDRAEPAPEAPRSA
jgi:hypothetical protein